MKQVDGVTKIPDILRSFEKKNYKVTTVVKEDNVKLGSKVYTATNISDPIEMSGNHSPNQNSTKDVNETEITMVCPCH